MERRIADRIYVCIIGFPHCTDDFRRRRQLNDICDQRGNCFSFINDRCKGKVTVAERLCLSRQPVRRHGIVCILG